MFYLFILFILMQNTVFIGSWLVNYNCFDSFHIIIAYLSTPPLCFGGMVWNGACLYAELCSVSLSQCHYGEVSSRERDHFFLKI